MLASITMHFRLLHMSVLERSLENLFDDYIEVKPNSNSDNTMLSNETVNKMSSISLLAGCNVWAS